MPTFAQASFAKGEIDPALHGRTDTAAYQIALATARNAIVQSYGGIVNRPGLQFIGPCKDHSTAVRLIDFQFKTTDTYIVELGNLYARFIRNDAVVTETAVGIDSVTAASPPVVTCDGAHGYTDGDEVLISGLSTATELNGNRFIIANKAATTFQLVSQADGTTNWAAPAVAESAGSAGTVGKVLEVVTPWATADLFELKYTQSADTMTIVHPTYAPRHLTRTAVNVFVLSTPTFAPTVTAPTGLALTESDSTTTPLKMVYKYKVTAFNEDGEESLSALSVTGQTVVNTEKTNPVRVEVTGHPNLTGDEVEINGLTQMTELNGRRFLVTYVDANHFTLDGEDGTAHGTAESTGGANKCHLTHVESDGTSPNILSTQNGAQLQKVAWTVVSGATRYAIYRSSTGNYGLVGETSNIVFEDTIDTPDTQFTPPTARNPFLNTSNYPGAVSYFEQRRVFGGTTNNPDTSYYSRVAFPDNFSSSQPTVDTDAITTALSSRKVNDIRHFVPGNDLLILTSGGEWRVSSGGDTAFTPGSISQKPQSDWGSSHREPIVIGNITLFVQENNANVRSLGYNLQLDGYTGSDLNLLTNHLIRNHTISDWCLAHQLDLIMMCRDDGEVLSLTFQPEQEVIGWAHWDTDGLFKSCASILPTLSSQDDAGYFVIERTINGNTVQYIEKTHSRKFDSVQDAFFVDSGLTLDTSYAISAVTLANPCVITTATLPSTFIDGDEVDISDAHWVPTLTANKTASQPEQLNGVPWFVADKTSTTFTPVTVNTNTYIVGITQADPGVVTTSLAHGLAAGDLVVLHNVLGMTEANDTVYKVKAVPSTTTFSLSSTADVDTDTSGFTAYTNGGSVHTPLDSSAYVAWVKNGKVREKTISVSGLDHLEGEVVVALANGNFVEGLTVSGGAITLADKASRVHVGMPYYTDIETLDAEPPKGTIIDKKKKVSSVAVKFNRSRGMLIGPDFNNLIEMKQRKFEPYGSETSLLTGIQEVKILPSWNNRGRVAIRQRYPLPIEIVAIAPDMELGD